MNRTIVAAVLAALCPGAASPSEGGPAAAMVRVPAGSYRPLYFATGQPRLRRVTAFAIDAFPVTNAEYLAFVREHAEWRRSRASSLFVDEAYLAHWAGDLEPGDRAPLAAPVVSVSWFAARAYLAARGKELPTVDQWEYLASAATRRVHGVDGAIREWTLDFNSSLVTGESRADASLDRALYCGAGAAAASDFTDYAAFQRYAFRGSLEARYSVPNLGFRGARSGAGEARLPRPPRSGPADGASMFALDVALTDQAGRRVRVADLAGHVQVATMIYSSCTSICPRVTEDLKTIERQLGARAKDVRFALFSLDPGRDSAQALRRFARDHQLDPARWRLFAASAGDVRQIAAVLGTRYAPAAAGDIAHSALIAVIDERGVVRHRQVGVGTDPRRLLDAIAQAGLAVR